MAYILIAYLWTGSNNPGLVARFLDEAACRGAIAEMAKVRPESVVSRPGFAIAICVPEGSR